MTAKFAVDCTNQFPWTVFPTESSLSNTLLGKTFKCLIGLDK